MKDTRWISGGRDLFRLVQSNTTAQGALALAGLAIAIFAAVVSPGPVAVLGGTVLVASALVLFFIYYIHQRHLGPYEVLDADIVWDIERVDGSAVVERKRFDVRFLQDNLICWIDYAFGDGELLAEYRCSPGKLVDVIDVADGRKWLVVSLGGMRNRGDRETLTTARLIKDGWTKDREWVSFEIIEPTRQYALTVRFPRGRPCSAAWLRRRGKRDEEKLDLERSVRWLDDGRSELKFAASRPALGDAVTVIWDW
jgi:hypothetical protein